MKRKTAIHKKEETLIEKIVLGLSGGVDSAVAARLLLEQGFEVYGLYLDIGTSGGRADAMAAAQQLGIPLYVADISAQLEERVCAPFVQAYLRGETPNPCILCNPTVKFKTLLDYADKIDAKYVATGHYARAVDGKLLKGRAENDQSYMLCRLTRAQLERVIFPLGSYNKAEVRALAEGFGLPLAQKPASMEICFIPDKDYGAYIDGRGLTPPPGNFVDMDGNVLGKHGGLHRYTVGQGSGLGVSFGKKVYVQQLRPETNEVVLCKGAALMAEKITVSDVNWLIVPEGAFSAEVRVRHSKLSTPARVEPKNGGADIFFETPVRAPTRGQTAVFYIGDVVAGGGFIN